ncbi:MAG: diguanylate cyclase [Proteobacteria bacterium]|nr:diguanylate cyclase [Pseudomonadota bacterium]HQR03243.1 diguanylate cyclase [Rhodocyclaceae bacterium]
MNRYLITILLLLVPLSAAALDKVTLQLKWKHQFQFAGYYAALEKGYYRDAGIDVTLAESTGTTSPVTEVVSGRAEYGIGTAELVAERVRGQPIVALATIIQHSPLVLITRGDINSPQALVGHSLMLLPEETELFAFLKRENADIQHINLRPHSANYRDMIAGKVDAISGYSTDEVFDLRQASFQFNQFSPRSSGVDFYGDTLFTSERHLNEHPRQVAAFRAASIKGWEYALSHVEEITGLILSKYSTRQPRTHLLFEAQEINRLMQPELVPIGTMNPGRWRHIADTYAEMNMIPPNPDLAGFIYDPRPKQMPAWAPRVALVALTLLAVLTAWLWRGAQMGKALRQTIHERDEALRDLKESQAHYQLIADNSNDVIWILDLASRKFTYMSPSVEILRGFKPEELVGVSIENALPPASAAKANQAIQDQVARIRAGDRSAVHTTLELEHYHRDGRLLHTEVAATALLDENGTPTRALGISRDVTERRRLEQALRHNEERLNFALSSADEGLWEYNLDSRIMQYTDQFWSHMGYAGDEIPSRVDSVLNVIHPEDRANVTTSLRNYLSGQSPTFQCECRLRTRNGDWRWVLGRGRLWQDEDGIQQRRIIGTQTDITERKHAEFAVAEANARLQAKLEEIEALQEQLAEQAARDGLTGLYNRRYLDQTLEREVARARREGLPLSIVMFDLDHFKQLNDTYGHQAGDAVLKNIADLLRADTRTEDIACRYGGEEFLILLPNMPLDIAQARAESWRQRIAGTSLDFGRFSLSITASFGVAGYPDHGKSTDTLTRAADDALYVAKRTGRNRVETFTPPVTY